MSLLYQIFVSLVLVIFTLLVWLYLKIHHIKKHLAKIPGPKPYPIIGNAADFKNGSLDFLPVFQKYSKKYGDIFKVELGLRYTLVITNHDMLEFVLNNSNILQKSEVYKFVKSWLGDGLLTGEGSKWKSHRKILTPAFHFQILESFIPRFEAADNILIKKLKSEVGKNSFDIYPYITLCTLDIICDSAMGVFVNAQENKKSDFVVSTQEMTRIPIERVMSIIKQRDLLYVFSKDHKKEKKALKVLHDFTTNIINTKKELLMKSQKEKTVSVEDDVGVKKRKAFLDLLLEATENGKPLSDKDIMDEVTTFIFAGHDTTSAALSFAIYSLANHPEEQEKAYQEQLLIFENKDDPLDLKKLQKMTYLENVIKETLRLYPSVPFIGRKIEQDIEYNGMVLPKGLTLLLFIYEAQRNEKYFKDPNTFNPSRFENIQDRKPYSFIPFSAGHRNCLGQKFAMYEMKAVLSKLLRTFELCPATPEHKIMFKTEIVLKAHNGIKISIKPRKQNQN